jgi:hypothetical protein
MFTKIGIDCLMNVVGFRQPFNDCLGTLSSRLTTSLSGFFFDDHPLISVDLLAMVAPQQTDFNLNSWTTTPIFDLLTTYNVNDIVVFGNEKYVSLANGNLGNTPNLFSAFWQFQSERFSLDYWLVTKVRVSIERVVSTLLNRKRSKEALKGIIEKNYLFTSIGNINDLETKQGRFVGFRIVLKKIQGLRLLIDKIGIQFSQTDNFNMYLYHSSYPNPIAVVPINILLANGFAWIQSQLQLFFDSNLYDSTGVFYLGYFENDLQPNTRAVKRQLIFGSNCGSCNGTENGYATQRNSFYGIDSIHIDNAFLNGTNLPNIGYDEMNVRIENNSNYGLNLSMSVLCDLNNLICDNAVLFADLIKKQFVVDMLREYDNSYRINSVVDKKMIVQSEFQKKQMNLPNAFNDLELAYKAFEFDFSNLSKLCLPCDSSNISMGVV